MKSTMVTVFILTLLVTTASAQEPFPGNTLISVRSSNETILIDLEGNVLQSWHGATGPSEIAYLLSDGSILRPTGDANRVFGSGGAGGRIQRIDANDNVVWDYVFSSETFLQHHDIEPMPNGNVLILAWDRKTEEEAMALGRLNVPRGELWPTLIVEVEPDGLTGGSIVWEWRLWDHLIQDVDPAKPNYGVVADHPELADINIAPTTSRSWDHANSMTYNPRRDQIVLSCRKFNEILVIDHSTTTEESAGHSGGNSGKGGDILYRWGNPQNYDRGTAADRHFINVHGGVWIDACLPGGGNILAFNNGDRGAEDDYSSVDEIVPPMDAHGNYIIEPGEPFGPAAPVWSFSSGPGFFARRQGGAFRLPNGNTLITDPAAELLFEVTQDKELVWFYFLDGSVHRANRYWSNTAVTLRANFDIMPRSCPNPFNITWLEMVQNGGSNTDIRKGGIMPAAIIGDACIDVSEIDVSTLRMGGLVPLRTGYEDVAGAAGDAQCECTSDGPDGAMDLTLMFSRMEVAGLLGSVGDGDVVSLRITGFMNDGSPIEGGDCIVVLDRNRDSGVPDDEEKADENFFPEIAAVNPQSYDTALLPNAPNPFNPATMIPFTLEKAAHVTLTIYDAKGRRVTTLVDEIRGAGRHETRWDGTAASGVQVSSGVYFYRLTAGKTSLSRRMVLLK